MQSHQEPARPPAHLGAHRVPSGGLLLGLGRLLLTLLLLLRLLGVLQQSAAAMSTRQNTRVF